MDAAKPTFARRAIELSSLALICAIVAWATFTGYRRLGFQASYSADQYESIRKRETGATRIEQAATGTVDGKAARWMALWFEDGKPAVELLVDQGDGSLALDEEGDASVSYSGPLREAVLRDASGERIPLRDLPAAGRSSFVALALCLALTAFTAYLLFPRPALSRAIGARFAVGALSLIFISFVVFIADEVAPGDAAQVRMGEKNFNYERYLQLREQMGLNRAWPIRYVEYLGKVAQFEFGESYYGTHEPVVRTIKRDLPMTARTAAAAICIAAILGTTLGALAAVFRTRGPDRTVLVFSTLGVTIPPFVLAPILVYIFNNQLDRLPATWAVERVLPDWMYLILPVAVLAARPTALLTRLTRASMIDTFQQEFIRTAIAKGVPPLRLILRHALRNAILPVITAIGTSFGFLLTGSFVVERAFTMPGLGSETIEAIQRGDTPLIQACILLTGALFIVVNLIVDLLLPLLDPRIREAQV